MDVKYLSVKNKVPTGNVSQSLITQRAPTSNFSGVGKIADSVDEPFP